MSPAPDRHATTRERLVAGVYDLLLEPLVAGFRHTALQLAPPETGMQVLDVGCGTGRHLMLYQSGGANVTGVDLSAGMLQRAARLLGPAATLIQADAAALPFEDESFDLVMAATVLHAVGPQVRHRVLDEMRRVAASGGSLLVIDPHPETPSGPRARFARALDSSIERVAGRDHYRNYRQFLATGGLPTLAAELHLSIVEQAVGASGTMGIYLLR